MESSQVIEEDDYLDNSMPDNTINVSVGEGKVESISMITHIDHRRRWVQGRGTDPRRHSRPNTRPWTVNVGNPSHIYAQDVLRCRAQGQTERLASRILHG